MRALLELRPALEGHSGIPQEARLLFAALAGWPGMEVEGLVQSGNLRIAPGLPLDAVTGRPLPRPAPERFERLSKVVVSLQQGRDMRRLERYAERLRFLGGAAGWALASLTCRPQPLEGFDPAGFEDWIWRSFFDKSVDSEDRSRVTSRPLRLLRTPWSVAQHLGLMLQRLRVGPGYPVVDAAGIDVVVAQTPFPARFAPPTRLVVRYHDAIPVLLPHTIKNMAQHRDMHHRALRRNAHDGAWFACVSDATRADLLRILPDVEPRVATIPNMVPLHFGPEHGPRSRVPEIVWARRNRQAPHGGGRAELPTVPQGAAPYLLMVSTIEPRKNHATLLEAWHRLRQQGHSDLQLVLVGSLGWNFESTTQLFEPWLARGGLHLLHRVPVPELRLLYRHAAATVCPSVHEGFDFPGVEAMACGGIVVASDIAVHREVFGSACEYFDPYSETALASCLELLLGPASLARREALLSEGHRVVQRYRPSQILPQWDRFLQSVAAAPAPTLPRGGCLGRR